jgi:hypothetical protein
MTNDLIVFEFQFDDQNLLPPEVVPSIASALQSALWSSISAHLPQGKNANVQVLLAGAERGSLKLAFKAIWNATGDEMVERRGSAIASGLTISTAAATAMVWAGVQIGVFLPEKEAPKPEHEVTYQIGRETAKDPQATENILRLANAALKTGATRVLIHVPDAPTCEIKESSSTDIRLLGSLVRGDPPFINETGISGSLLLNDEKFLAASRTASGKEDHMTLHGGTIEIDGTRHPVLVNWQSKRAVPTGMKDRVDVRGTITPFNQARIVILEAIPPSGRRAIGLLRVDAQIVEE